MVVVGKKRKHECFDSDIVKIYSMESCLDTEKSKLSIVKEGFASVIAGGLVISECKIVYICLIVCGIIALVILVGGDAHVNGKHKERGVGNLISVISVILGNTRNILRVDGEVVSIDIELSNIRGYCVAIYHKSIVKMSCRSSCRRRNQILSRDIFCGD